VNGEIAGLLENVLLVVDDQGSSPQAEAQVVSKAVRRV
jgi:hypothetical protein